MSKGSVKKLGKYLAVTAMSSALMFPIAGTGQRMVKADSTTPFVEGWWAWPPMGILNPFSPNAIQLYGFINSPLAYYTQFNNSFVPQIATSWNMKAKPGDAANGTLTIHLRKNATWSDGSPITSGDVKMSLELGYILSSQVSTYIDSIQTPDAHTVVIKQNTKPFNLFTQQILTTWMYPKKVWGKYVPSNIHDTYVTSEGTGGAATKAQDTLAKIAKQLAAVNVKNYVSSGPYNVTQVTSSQITMAKNEKWWGAAKVHVPTFELLAESGNTQAYSFALSQRADYLNTYAPPTVVDPFLAKPNDYIAAPDGNYGPGLFFNTSVKPYNDVRVRQAFAYIIDRNEVEQIAYPVGTSSVKAAVTTKYPTGLPPYSYNRWLTQDTLNKLNPYKKNTQKAAQLLQSAGFKKVGGSWQLNGKPFNVEVACPSGYTDWVAISENIVTQLNQFGINAKLRTVDTNTYFAKVPKGDFTLALNSSGSSNLSPWYDYGMIINNGEGLSINSKGKISRTQTSYNWGPTVNVQGLGKVNVVTLWDQLVNTTDQSKQKQAVNKLALTVNQQLPSIDLLYNKFYAIFYNTNHWTGFPSANNPLWDINISANSPALMFIEAGYIKPVH